MIDHGRYGPDPVKAWDKIKEEIDFYNKIKGIK
jgi:hypothetical protein